MEISKKNKINNAPEGFTLIELVVVLGGLSALMAFALPNLLTTYKLNRIEEAKAIMNSYAADCIGKWRIEPDSKKFRQEAKPPIDNDKLGTLGYKIDGYPGNDAKNTCEHTKIIPNDKNEKFLFAFDFRVDSGDGKVSKGAEPSNEERALNSCKGWAGEFCGLSDKQKKDIQDKKDLQIAKENCENKFDTWLYTPPGGTGSENDWDEGLKKCEKKTCAYKGEKVSCNGGIDKAREEDMGQQCVQWITEKSSDKNYITPPNKIEGESTPECNEGKKKYWFHTGNDYEDQDDWYIKSCNYNYTEDKKKHEGPYEYKPKDGPKPCGDEVYICKGTTVSYERYKETCGAAPPPPPPPPPPKEDPPPPPTVVDPVTRKEITCPGAKPPYCNNPWLKWRRPQCNCWNTL